MMSALNYASVANSRGFQRRVLYAMFEVAKEVLTGTPTVNETAYVFGILNGQAPVLQVALGVLLSAPVRSAIDLEQEPSGKTVTDAQIKTAVQAIFTIYADAWAVK